MKIKWEFVFSGLYLAGGYGAAFILKMFYLVTAFCIAWGFGKLGYAFDPLAILLIMFLIFLLDETVRWFVRDALPS